MHANRNENEKRSSASRVQVTPSRQIPGLCRPQANHLWLPAVGIPERLSLGSPQIIGKPIKFPRPVRILAVLLVAAGFANEHDDGRRLGYNIAHAMRRRWIAGWLSG